MPLFYIFFFFFNDTATTEIYTLSLHDALPISHLDCIVTARATTKMAVLEWEKLLLYPADRKSTRLNSIHITISYAVFCLKKKKFRRRRHAIATARYLINKDAAEMTHDELRQLEGARRIALSAPASLHPVDLHASDLI